MNKILLITLLLLSSILGFAQIEYVNSPPFIADSMAQRLVGKGVEVFNASLICPDDASGFFWNGATTNLGIESGIVLTTGSTEIAFSANTVGDAGVNNGGDGYAPFEDFFPWAYYGGTFNACVLEFDFISYGNRIYLNYVFGSEEYPEWVGSQFNDIFAILIEGLPQYPEDMPVTERNMAIIPTSPGIHVAINFLNFASYNDFYQDNTADEYIQYDGQTIRLPARATVTPCNTYHLALAIADSDDGKHDSGLFFEENSFNSNILKVESVSTNIGENNQTIGEGSSEGVVTFSKDFLYGEGEVFPFLTTPSHQPIQIILGGTATLFEDYELDKSQLLFPPPEEESLFPTENLQQVKITPIEDGIEEETEYITFGVFSGCSQLYFSIDTLWLEDAQITGVGEGGAICPGDDFQLSVIGQEEGMSFEWSPTASLNDPTIENPIASPTETTTYVVNITGKNGYQAQHAVTVEVLELPSVNLITASESICPNIPAVITMSNYHPQNTYTFYDENGEVLLENNLPPLLVYPSMTTTYSVIVTNESGCTATGDITIEVQNIELELASQFIACENEALTLSPTTNFSNLYYKWTPDIDIDDPNAANPTFTPTESRTYKLVTTTHIGCQDSIETFIEVTNDCVFPGDADNSGQVDMFDLFPLGRSFEKEGFARNSISNEWQGFGAFDWGETQGNGQNLKYVDCNGNGSIGFEDMTAIVLNFNLMQKSGGFTKGGLDDPELQFIPSSEAIGLGEWFELEVWIGSDTYPVSDLYAIAFETHFDTNLIDGNSISMDYSGSHLGELGVNLLATDWVNEDNGRINASLTKTNGMGESGIVYLMTLRMRSQPNVVTTQDFTFNITDFGATDSGGDEIFVNVDETPSIHIDPDIVGIEEPSSTSHSKPYQLFPSFTQDGFYLDYTLQKDIAIEASLFALSGQKMGSLLKERESNLGSFQRYIDLQKIGLNTGVYVVELQLDGVIYREKVVVF